MVKIKKTVVRTRREDASGVFVPAGLLIGLGIGGIYGTYGIGAILGLGVGLCLMAIAKLIKR